MISMFRGHTQGCPHTCDLPKTWDIPVCVPNRCLLLILFFLGLCFFSATRVHAAPAPSIVMPNITIQGQATQPKNLVVSIQILVFLAVISLAPYLMMMTTSFVRVIIVLSFIRSSLGTQQVPPTQVLMGLALFITFYIMSPVWRDINDHTLRPYLKGDMNQAEALGSAMKPINRFMLKQVKTADLALFYDLAKLKHPKTPDEIKLYVLLPAFMVSEVKAGFEMGFLIYIPFLIIDMVVANVLMSMGMFMLSPMSISLPFKLLLFVMVDGWELIIKGLVLSFH